MKKADIRRLMFLLLAGAITTSSIAWSGEVKNSEVPQTQVWVKSEERIVYFAPKPDLSIAITHILDDEEEYYDQLDVEMRYQPLSVVAQADSLRAKYPGYEVRRVMLGKKSNFMISIPILNIQEETNTLPTQDGPYFRYQAFVPKNKAAKVRQELDENLNFITVTGQVQTEIPGSKVVEHIEINDSICDDLISSESSVYDVIRKFPAVLKKVDGMAIQLSNTRETLKRSILEGCIDLPVTRVMDSFSDLLAMKVLRKRGGHFVGETSNPTQVNVIFNLLYTASKKQNGSSS